MADKNENKLWHDSRIELTDNYLLIYNSEVIGMLPLNSRLTIKNIVKVKHFLRKKFSEKLNYNQDIKQLGIK